MLVLGSAVLFAYIYSMRRSDAVAGGIECPLSFTKEQPTRVIIEFRSSGRFCPSSRLRRNNLKGRPAGCCSEGEPADSLGELGVQNWCARSLYN